MKCKILVSACLMGFQVRYNGSEKARLADVLARWQRDGRLVIHCPELAAGLPVPRLPAEILHAQGADVMQDRARIVESDGQDVTPHYQLAAWLALRTAQEAGCKAALLTDGSPTCGLKCAAVEADAGQVWGGMVWHASPLQRFAETEGVYTEELKAELAARGMGDVRLLSLPEVPEAGSIPDALAEIGKVFEGVP